MNDTAATPALDALLRDARAMAVGQFSFVKIGDSRIFADAMVKAALSAALADTPEARAAIKAAIADAYLRGGTSDDVVCAILAALRQLFLGEE